MKKIKLLSALMVIILCASMVLTACGEKEVEITTYKLADIMNAEYAAEEKGVLSTSNKLTTVGDYVTSKGNFLVTSENVKATEEEPVSYDIVRIYNIATGKTLATLSEKPEENNGYTITADYYVHIISNDYFALLAKTKSVAKTPDEDATPSNSAEYYTGFFSTESGVQMKIIFNDEYTNTLTIRDANGQVVETVENNALWSACAAKNSFDAAYWGSSYYASATEGSIAYEYQNSDIFTSNSSNDLVLVGKKLYRVDKDDNAVLVKDFGLAKQPQNVTHMEKVGDFYLCEEGGYTYIVYDKDLNELYRYVLPEYADIDSCTLLANGELLVQYSIALEETAKEFDYISPQYLAQKYDLVTILVNAEGTTEVADVNYMIGRMDVSVADEDGQKVYSDLVENLAFIYYINEDKYIDTGVANRKLVLLSNKCEVTAEVVVEEAIAESFPTHYLDEYYMLTLEGGNGYAIYDKTGAKVSELSKTVTSSTLVGDNFLNKDALYDITGNQVKDLSGINYKILGDSFFIETNGANGDSYSLFVDGKSVSIGNTTTDTDNKDALKAVVADVTGGYYATRKTAKNESTGKTDSTYTYYNEKGTKLVSTEYSLSTVSVTEEFVLVGGKEQVETMENGIKKTEMVTVFYRFDIK